MKNFKLGIMAECFRLGFARDLEKAAECGADGVQLGETGHTIRTAAEITEMRRALAQNGLVVSAVCAEMGGYAESREQNSERIVRTKRIIDFALELGTKTLTGHIGVIPTDTSSEKYAIIYDACAQIAEYARSAGVTFAVETGPEPAPELKAFLDRLGGGLGVNFDPANLMMAFDNDTAADVAVLKNYIVHTHAKDGIYKGRTKSGGGEEVPLGKGDVNFPAWMGALKASGYNGFLTIEREVGADPVADIISAAKYLAEIDAML